MSDGPCWETKYYIADLESIYIHVTHPCLYKCLQVHVNTNAGQVCIGEAFSKLAKYEQDSGK